MTLQFVPHTSAPAQKVTEEISLSGVNALCEIVGCDVVISVRKRRMDKFVGNSQQEKRFTVTNLSIWHLSAIKFLLTYLYILNLYILNL